MGYKPRHASGINQYNQEQNQQPPGLISESWLFLRSFRNPNLLAVYKPDAKFSHSALEGADDSLVWHEQARSLLELSSKSYEFQNDQWHNQQKCWLACKKDLMRNSSKGYSTTAKSTGKKTPCFIPLIPAFLKPERRQPCCPCWP